MFSKNNKCTKESFEAACKNLTADKLGGLEKRAMNESTRTSQAFVKTKPDGDSIAFSNSIIKYLVDFDEYSHAYKALTYNVTQVKTKK